MVDRLNALVPGRYLVWIQPLPSAESSTTQESGQGIRDRAKRIEEIEAALRAIAGAGAFGS